ncbi:MAG: Peptidase family M50 [Lentisphaerae bacterium ADurb.Bin242]|nr:MAG: Peptidase family M50 [Lentisphaerae bacterium ADurb.Bin242]
MLFIQTLFTNPSYFLMVCLIVVFSVCLHEYFHAQAAVLEGDYTLRDHLTLNPFKQMGFMSLLMLALIGIAWGGVPVERNLLRSRWSMLKISLAGPLANLLLLLCAWILNGVLYLPKFYRETPEYVMILQFVMLFGIYNFVLLVFNLIPAPGLDGWNILSEIFPKMRNISSELVKGAMLFLMLLAFIGVQFLFALGSLVMTLSILLIRGTGYA